MPSITPLNAHDFVVMVYSSTIGAVICVLTSILLLCNLIHVYITMFYHQRTNTMRNTSANSTEPLKTGYILAIMYVMFTLISCCSHSFIRTNTFTRISLNQFSSYQCLFGYILSYFASYIATAILYISFVWRVNTTFQDSSYSYKSCTIKMFYIIIITVVVLMSGECVLEVIYSHWNILHDHKHNLSFCSNDSIDHVKIVQYTWIICSSIFSVFHFAVSICLLFMFTNGLWQVNKGLIRPFMKEHGNLSINIESVSMNTVIEECLSDKRNSIQQQKITQEAERIFVLHHLIKKQTILVCISIISSVTLWILTAINDWVSLQIYWDLTINSVCLCLMLASSKQYWILCTKYCLCCCYRKENSLKV
eukprot:136262_1